MNLLRLPLLVPAVTAWLLALVLIGRSASLAWAAAALGLALAVAGILLRRRAPGGAALLGMVLVAVGVAGAAVGVRCAVAADVRVAEPWSGWATARAAVQVRAVAVEPAVAVGRTAPWGAGSTSERVVAEVRSARSGGTEWEMSSRVLLLLDRGPEPPSGRGAIGIGDEVSARVRVSAGEARRGLVATLTSVGDVEVVPASGPLAGVRGAARALFTGSPAARPAAGDLALGMVIGDDSGLPPPEQQDLRDAGLTHLTAVSGANIAMVLGTVLFLARITLSGTGQRGLRWALVPALALLAGYVAVVGPSPSVLRATAMAVVGVAAVVLGGTAGASALLIAVLSLVVLDPYLAGSWGFALSVAATAGLIAVAGPGARLARNAGGRAPPALRWLVAGVVGALVVSAAAALATAPLLAAFGQGVSWVSVAANLAVAPAVPVITVAGLVALVLVPVWSAAAAAVAAVPVLGAGWVLEVAHTAARVPGGRLPWPQGIGWAVLLAALLAGIVLVARWRPRQAVALALSIAAASVVLAAAPGTLGGGAPADWRAVFCDVGQGDAIVLRSGPDAGVLIDAGPDADAAAQCLSRSGIERLDAIVLSHFHRDHVAGLATVLARWRPAQILVSPLAEPPEVYREVKRVAAAAALPLRVPPMGETARSGWASWTVVAPRRVVREGSAPNNASVTLLAQVGPGQPVRILLGGDLEPAGQSALMGGMAPPRVDVAKVPHHGSSHQHPALPGWAGAAAAIISVGADNDYGHPAPATVVAWQASGAQVFRTDRDGDVIVAVDEGDGGLRVFGRPPAGSR